MQTALVVFLLVVSGFTNIYITQPVLPAIAAEYGVSASTVSITVSAVIAGLALSNIPWGILADRLRIQPILVVGGVLVSVFGLIASQLHDLYSLAAVRFLQGLALPSMMTCIAAYLGRTLPASRMNLVLGAYVSATVTGGLLSRLLAGWFLPESDWRTALIIASGMTLFASLLAARLLPDPGHSEAHRASSTGFINILRIPIALRIYAVAFSAFFVFQSMFNFLPFRLTSAPLNLSVTQVTSVYLSYMVGILMGPVSGALSNRLGNGPTVFIGSLIMAIAVSLTLVDSTLVIAGSLLLLCVGFFALHAAAAGALNRSLEHGKGRANALYVLFYYGGGFTGISVGGHLYEGWGWTSLVITQCAMLMIPATIGLYSLRRQRAAAAVTPPPG